MKRAAGAARFAVLVISGITLLVSWRSQLVARHQAERSLARTHVLVSRIDQLNLAQDSNPPWATRRRPAPGVAAKLGDTLASCGIPTASLADVTPQPDAPVPGASGGARITGLRRQRTMLTLSPVTLPQLGAFLQTWRQRQPDWCVTGIEVSPAGTGGLGGGGGPGSATGGVYPAPGGDLPLRAVLVMDAVYLDIAGDRP
jgi:hypothetical protein